MKGKKSASNTPEGDEQMTHPIVTETNSKVFEKLILDGWQDYLKSDGELLLGPQLASIAVRVLKLEQAVKAIHLKDNSYESIGPALSSAKDEMEGLRNDFKLHKDSIVNLNKRLSFLEKEFSTLCNKRNEDFHALQVIGQKQRDFINDVKEKLRRLGL